jgi:hypothetical protein
MENNMRDELLEQLLEQQIITNSLLQKQIELLMNCQFGAPTSQDIPDEHMVSIKFSELLQIRVDYFNNSKIEKVIVEIDDGINKGQGTEDRTVRNPKYSVSFYSGTQRVKNKKGKEVRNGISPKLIKKSVGVFSEDIEAVPERIIKLSSQLNCDASYYFRFHDRLSTTENNSVYIFECNGGEFLLFLIEDDTLYVAGRELTRSKGSDGYFAYLRPADFQSITTNCDGL